MRCSICVEIQPGDRYGAKIGNVDRTVVGDALRAEISAGTLDCGKHTALVGLEDPNLEHVARSDRNTPPGRKIAGRRRHVDRRGRPVGHDGGGRQVDDVERQRLGGTGARIVHPWPVSGNSLATGNDTQTEDNGSRSRSSAQPAPYCQIRLSVQNGRQDAVPRPLVLPSLPCNYPVAPRACKRSAESVSGSRPSRTVASSSDSATSSSFEKPLTSRQSAAGPPKRQNTTRAFAAWA